MSDVINKSYMISNTVIYELDSVYLCYVWVTRSIFITNINWSFPRDTSQECLFLWYQVKNEKLWRRNLLYCWCWGSRMWEQLPKMLAYLRTLLRTRSHVIKCFHSAVQW